MTQDWLKKAVPVEPAEVEPERNDWLKGALPVSDAAPLPAGGIQLLKSDLPTLPKRFSKQTKIVGKEPMIIEVPESGTAYKKRLIDYYGFSEVPEKLEDNYARLQEAAGFTPGRQEDLQRIVKKAFGEGANLANYEGYPDPVVVLETGEVFPFNQPGLTTQDIRGLRAGAGVLSLETAGGLTGLIGGPLGVAAGVGAGAFGGEYARLKRGQELGWHDLSNSEVLGRAAIDAAIAVGLEVTTLGAGALVRRFVTGKAGKAIVGDLTEVDIEAAVRAADDYAAETGQALTAGQAVQQAERSGDIAGKDLVAAEMRTVEEALSKSGVAPELRTQLGEQRAALTAGVREAEQVAAPDLLGTEAVGRGVQEEAARDIAAQTQDIMMAADIRRGAQEDIIQAEIQAPELLETSEGLRAYVEGARKSTFDQLGERYERFYAEVPDELNINIEGVKESAASLKKEIDEDLIPRLTEEDVPILQQIIDADEGKTIESVSRAISQLKAEQRALNAGLPAQARQKSMVNKLVTSLEEARDNALRDIDPALREELRAIDAQYAQANKDIYGSLLGRMVAKDKQGGYRISDDKLFEKFAANPSEVRNLTSLINDPEYAGFGGTSLIKDGFNSLYRDKVIDGTMKHSTFMRQYGRSMKEILPPEQMKKFDTYASAQKNIALIDKIEKNEINELKRTIGYKLGDYNAEDVLNNVKGSVSKVKDVKRILSRSPDKWDYFKKLYARDFLNSVMKDGDFGPEFSVSKLGSMLKADKGELTEIFGKRYVNDLGWLKSQAEVIGVPKAIRGAAADILKETPPLNPIMAIWRATIARPLSREGLLTTGAMKMIRRGSRKALGEVLQNPANLRKLHQLYVKDAPLSKWRSFFRSIGYNEMVDAMQEKEE